MWPQGLLHRDIYMLQDYFFYDRARFEYKYSLWPRRCHNTKRWLWFTLAMRGRAVWHGPGEPAVEDRWYHRNEALVIMLKKVSE